jgi:prepilin-type N-terminal cleavage/methylation domain-containing protein
MIKSKNKGFTLIEVIVVVFLSVMILGILYNILLLTQKARKSGDIHLELIQNGRIILDRISRELRQSETIITEIPQINNDPELAPPAEIEFQDGHDLNDIQYIRYFMNNNQLFRQKKIYFFSDSTSTHVIWNALDLNNNPPSYEVTEERIIAEYIQNIKFWGEKLIFIDIYLNKEQTNDHLLSAVWGRNLR